MATINQNQVNILNILFKADKIFTGIRSQYKRVDNKYVLSRTKIDEKESDMQPQQSDERPDTTDTPDLESEESTVQRRNQQGQGLKILKPNQIFSRLPISLAQLKAVNNYKKLKNEIKQLLYSFYRSKKLTKQLYKSLIYII